NEDRPGAVQRGNSAGSNREATSRALVDRVKDDAEKLKAENLSALLPAIFVTTSASGLHPDITPAAAEFQVPRVAKARKLSPDKVRTLVAKMTQDRFVGILGEKRSISSSSIWHLMRLLTPHASVGDAAFEAGIQ